MRKRNILSAMASVVLALVLIINIPVPTAEAKKYTEADVIKLFKGDTELDKEKVLDVIAGMDLNTKQRNFFKSIIAKCRFIKQRY